MRGVTVGQSSNLPPGGRRWAVQPTCQAERLEAELGAVQDDKAVCLVQPARRVLHVALKVSGLLARSDLLDLPDVDCGRDAPHRERRHHCTHTCRSIRWDSHPSKRWKKGIYLKGLLF